MNRPLTAPLPGTLEDPRYPDQDGRFMGDTDFHHGARIDLWRTLDAYFARQDVKVASNLIYYYKEGDPKARCDPDILVARGVGKHLRRSYRIWEEKVVPCTLFEIASGRTWRVDLGKKRQLYASLGVKEYFVFDPEGCYIKPVLQGFRTVRGRSVAMKPARDGSLVSKELGLRLVPEGEMLRLIDRETGAPVPMHSELAAQAHERARQEGERVEQERRRAQQERRRARRQQLRVQALEAEVERLRALLAKRRRRP